MTLHNRTYGWLLAVFFSVGAMSSSAMAALGVHGLGGTEGDCAACHNVSQTAKLRGWGITGEPTGGNAWYGRPIAKLCWTCHKSPNAYTASDMDAFAFADGSHRFNETKAPFTTNAWEAGSREAYGVALNLPYVTDVVDSIDCTSCHNVHADTYRPFSMKGPGAGDFSALCTTCHLNRANATLFGAANSVNGVSTHPTDVVIDDNGGNGTASFLTDCDARLARTVNIAGGGAWTLGGHLKNPSQDNTVVFTKQFTCGTCHMVHGDTVTSITGNDALLVINSLYQANSPLCTGCHDQVVGAAGSTNHPLSGDSGRAFYPGDWADAVYGIPTSWQEAGIGGTRVSDANGNSHGATTINIAGSGVPSCSSCHDVHGGVAATSLNYGPIPASAGGEWCFSCHLATGVIPDYHHSCAANDDNGSTFTSQLGCGDCHGAKGGTSANDGTWAAHNGFWAFRKGTAVSDSDSLLCAGTDNTSGCHKDIAPTTFWDGAKSGLSTYDLTSFPTSHGADRGDASHYLGTDSNEFGGVDPNTGPWPALDGGLPSIQYYSEYGGQTGGGDTPPSGAGDIICESCHNILYNAGSLTTPASTLYGGWQANLLLEPYEDDTAGTAQGETPNYFSGSTGDALCAECHTGSGTHHPIGAGLDMTKADQTVPAAAPNGLSFPASGSMDCDSCHRPHDADDDSVTASPTPHGHTNPDGKPTYHILELDGADHDWSVLCDDCHAK